MRSLPYRGQITSLSPGKKKVILNAESCPIHGSSLEGGNVYIVPSLTIY